MEKLKYHYGTEFTFHWPNRRQRKWDFQYALSNELYAAFGAGSWNNEVYSTIEVHSPVLTTWKRFQAFYDFVHTQARRERLRIRVRGWSTGGGHLHVSGPYTQTYNLRRFIQHDRANRPYLNWVFNDPEDMTTFAEGPMALPSSRYVCRCRSCSSQRGQITQPELIEPKRYTITCRPGTIEFRLFEMPRNWDEQVLHILFCEKYLTWARGRTPPELAERPFWSFDLAKGIFNDFLEEIGLDPYPYSALVNCNLKARFSPGFALSE